MLHDSASWHLRFAFDDGLGSEPDQISRVKPFVASRIRMTTCAKVDVSCTLDPAFAVDRGPLRGAPLRGARFFSTDFMCPLQAYPQTLHNLTRFRRAQLSPNFRLRMCCSHDPDTCHGDDAEEISTEKVLPEPVLYQSWRNPSWLFHQRRQHYIVSCSGTHLLVDGKKKYMPLKMACAVAACLSVGFLSSAYSRFNSFTTHRVAAVAEETLQREIRIGRVVRWNPLTGLRLRDVSINPPTGHPTSPSIMASSLDMSLSGLGQFILRRNPLRLNVLVYGAQIRVSQVVVSGPKGILVGQWDSGILPSEGDTDNRTVDGNPGQEWLRHVELGTAVIRNSVVILQPARFQDYGHGDETIEIQNVRAKCSFPSPSSKAGGISSGDLMAWASGSPQGGGEIMLKCFVYGQNVEHRKGSNTAVDLNVFGSRIRAERVASFLNLPFRATGGLCSANVNLRFVHGNPSPIPDMKGTAELDSVGLRFHPDPKTPQFHAFEGKLRFEGKRVFLDGPTGKLGSLPMTIVGAIHLDDGYELIGYTRTVDAYHVIETFQVDKFVPVEGNLEGEVHMSGTLEEPVLWGWIHAVGDRVIFDRLPLTAAKFSFEWDVAAGTLKFPDISASVDGGGQLCGGGGIFFDMTQDSPYELRKARHHSRNPKSQYGTAEGGGGLGSLPAQSDDPFEIDELASCRPYDSVHFSFQAANLNGGELLRHYGGTYGSMATAAIGRVNGECVLAGPVRDTNCKVSWRSTGEPPDSNTVVGGKRERDSSCSTGQLADRVSESSSVETGEDSPAQTKGFTTTDVGREASTLDSGTLGGGAFQGLLFLKLGDLPEARRVKIRTLVKNFDARRAGWAEPAYRRYLVHTPLASVSMDTYFKGVMFQRPLLEAEKPRTPRLELLGVDGALAVRSLTVNNIFFNHVMNGSFSFSSSDFSVCLKESRVGEGISQNEDADSPRVSDGASASSHRDELSLSVSLKGEARAHLRHSSSEVVASLSATAKGHSVAHLSIQNVVLQDWMGNDRSASGGEALCGTAGAEIEFDFSSRQGAGLFSLDKLGLGPIHLTSASGEIVWHDRDLVIKQGVVKYRKSEYLLDARYTLFHPSGRDFGWEVSVGVPSASVRDVAKLVQGGNAFATAVQGSVGLAGTVQTRYSAGPVWIQKLSASGMRAPDMIMHSWDVPTDIPFSQQMRWYDSFVKGLCDFRRPPSRSRLQTEDVLKTVDIHGDVSGQISIKYSSSDGYVAHNATSAGAFLESALDQLARTTFSFRLAGKHWRIDGVPIASVGAAGRFEDGSLSLGPCFFSGVNGFSGDLDGRVSSAGSLAGSVSLQKLPAALLNRIQSTGLKLAGELDGRLKLDGSVSNPKALGRVIWSHAAINGRPVRGAKTDLACVNGRCIVNMDAKIGSWGPSTIADDESSPAESLAWTEKAPEILQDLAARASSRSEVPSLPDSLGRKQLGESIKIQISAPVRFYIMRHLKLRASSARRPDSVGPYAFDDGWILLRADIRRYGLFLINGFIPELGWEGGDSDVSLRVFGDLSRPVVEGRVTVSDGRIWPLGLTVPIHSVRGEILFCKRGLVSVKSLTGRCNGRIMSLNGDMFLSKRRREEATDMFSRASEKAFEMKGDLDAKAEMTSAAEELEELMRKGTGMQMEFRDVPVNVENLILGRLSGRVDLGGVLLDPAVSGFITLSDGFIHTGGTAASHRDFTLREELTTGTINNLSASTSVGVPNTSRYLPTSERRSEGILGEVGSAYGEVFLSDVQLIVGKNVKVVHPFVMEVNIAGSLRASGSSNRPHLKGKIDFLQGSVNLLPTPMTLRADENNYLKFSGENPESEPSIQVTLESDTVLVRIAECGLSSWADNLTITDKVGNRVTADWWSILKSGLQNEDGRFSVSKLVTTYLFNAAAAGGRAGVVFWKVYPCLLRPSEERIGEARNGLGAGLQLEADVISVSVKRSFAGMLGGALKLRLLEWLSLHIGVEGSATEIGISTGAE